MGNKKELIIFYIVLILIVIINLFIFLPKKDKNNNTIIKETSRITIKNVGMNYQLNINEKYKDDEIVFYNYDDSIISVDNNGIIVAVGEGSTVISIMNKRTNEHQSIKVTVDVDKTTTKETQRTKKTNKKTIPTTKKTDKKTTTIKSTTKVTDRITSNITTSKKVTTNKVNKTEKTTINKTTTKISTTKATTVTNQKTTHTTAKLSSTTKTTKTTKISVTGITLNKKSDTIYLNADTKKITLIATVTPSNALNKSVLWSSSDTNVATVSGGVVTAKSLGKVTITAKTVDGEKIATAVITIKQKVAVVIGASQVTRMDKYALSYKSTRTNYSYKKSDKTLIYSQKGGTGIDYQYNEGFNNAKATIDSLYNNKQNYIELYVFFPLSGNTIKTYTCSSISTTNSTMISYIKNYNNAIKKLITAGYNAKGYVVSMHPVKVSQSSSSTVVSNQNANSCKKTYRSNRKYNRFNIAVEGIMKELNLPYIQYELLFDKIMLVKDIDKNYSYKITYNTTDGVHWDDKTTNEYVGMMLYHSGEL